MWKMCSYPARKIKGGSCNKTLRNAAVRGNADLYFIAYINVLVKLCN